VRTWRLKPFTKIPKRGEVNVIPTESADEQIKNVADEIERLRDRENWEYEDFAVALKQSGSAVIETLVCLPADRGSDRVPRLSRVRR